MSVQATRTCGNCQFRVLSTFAAAVGICLHPPKASRLQLRQGPRHRQTFAATARRPTEDIKLIKTVDSPYDDQAATDASHKSSFLGAELVAEQSGSSSATYTPWYLQEHGTLSKQDQNPFSERQRLPDLPDNPPPILQSILEHISTDLGLDDLSLLDLRNLDPPPALGGNLIMIIGTARSEKHLHVSADRHCRWLRSTYKLHPFADGLLGRNEIKLRLRRKARRSKIMRNAGASEAGDTDDELRTGWVCVNVGTVQPSASQPETEGAYDDQTFVGFGSRSEGIRLVVQMFTEEKRGQLDLDTLWGGVLRRSAKEKEKEREAAARQEVVDQVAQNNDVPTANDHRLPNFQDHHEVSMQTRPASSQPRPGLGSLQLRAFHSTRKAFDAVGLDEKEVGASSDALMTSESPIDIDERDPVSGLTPNTLGSAETLRILLKQLRNAPAHQARKMIGEAWTINSEASLRSPFMDRFMQNFPSFPETSHWQSLIGLARLAVELHSIGRRNLIITLRDMQEAGEPISRETYVALLETVTQVRPDNQTLSYVFDILDMMACDGYSIFEESIFFLLHDAIVPPTTRLLPSGITEDECSLGQKRSGAMLDRSDQTMAHQEKVLAAMDHFFVTFSSDAPYLSLLRSYASSRYWPGFLSVWSSLPRRMRSRSREMYSLFYTALADSQEKDMIRKVLHDTISDMEAEWPPVEFDKDMAEMIGKCVKVVMPDVDGSTSKERQGAAMGNWDTLWGRCQRALKR